MTNQFFGVCKLFVKNSGEDMDRLAIITIATVAVLAAWLGVRAIKGLIALLKIQSM